MISLYDYQLAAVELMQNGCILCGGVGSGKSRTALAYYHKQNGGDLYSENPWMKDTPKDLYVITTARKRDTREWELDMAPFCISPEEGSTPYKHKVVIDSWNNIQKYSDVENAFFIFDEQRVVGKGTWVKAFLKIAKSNEWILLSATPGDTWEDYIPVFLANGFYKNRTEFLREHVIFSRFSKYPKIERYVNTGRLIRLRNKILVDMEFTRHTIPHHEHVICDYDILSYKQTMKNRWNYSKDEPIETANELCIELRRIVNCSTDRQLKLLDILEKNSKAIIFYNYDCELEILKTLPYIDGTEIAEWNGHKHQPIPTGDRWVYLVQYNAGNEGWNCIKTDTIIFYSQNYSYKVMTQAAGRIDRLNTPFINLYYYHLKSKASIDLAISKALNTKKNFNEQRFFTKL